MAKIPTMDYFISSRLTEPAEAEQHYSESLVRFDRLPLYLERPALADSPVSLESIGLERKARHLHLCAQNLRKLHPDQDHVIGAILRRDPNGLVVFFQHETEGITERFKLRLSITQADVADRVMVSRRLSYQEYLALLHHADVILDSLYFGGASTAYDAFAMHRPVVTLPASHARGRYTAGCYAAMGIEGCIASDPDSYVAIAVRLANDPDILLRLWTMLGARSGHAAERIAAGDRAVGERSDGLRLEGHSNHHPEGAPGDSTRTTRTAGAGVMRNAPEENPDQLM